MKLCRNIYNLNQVLQIPLLYKLSREIPVIKKRKSSIQKMKIDSQAQQTQDKHLTAQSPCYILAEF